MTWYTGDPLYDTLLASGLAFAGLVAICAPFVPSPYGRFASRRHGVALPPRWGWLLMELPATGVFLAVFAQGPHRAEPVPLVFLGLWLVHYANRGFLFPLLLRVPRGATATFGLLVLAAGWLSTGLHGYLSAAFFARHGTHYTLAWLGDARFLAGLLLYVVSLLLNLHSDHVLRVLRTYQDVASGARVYRVPRGGLFRWVSSPSYLTEITAWAGFALYTWSLAGVFILALTAGNLVPRAAATHRWYRERFAGYPPERKVLIPFIW